MEDPASGLLLKLSDILQEVALKHHIGDKSELIGTTAQCDRNQLRAVLQEELTEFLLHRIRCALDTNEICERVRAHRLDLNHLLGPADALEIMLVAYGRDDIGHNGTCGRHLAGTHTIEHGRTETVSDDPDTVVNTIDAEKRVGFRNHHRDDIGEVLILDLLYGAEQLDGHTQFTRIEEVQLRNCTDTLGIDVLMTAAIARCHTEKDRRFTGGVEAVDIGGRVTLRIAEMLCLDEGFLELGPLLTHLREDEVRGTVHDTGDLGQILAGIVMVDRTDDRDTTTDGSLEIEITVMLAGDADELRADRIDECLVGGDTVLPLLEAGLHKLIRRVDAAHGLDDELDLRIVLDDGKVGNQLIIIDTDVGTKIQYILELDRLADLLFDLRLIDAQYLCYAGADGAIA